MPFCVFIMVGVGAGLPNSTAWHQTLPSESASNVNVQEVRAQKTLMLVIFGGSKSFKFILRFNIGDISMGKIG